jgi:hypothetical protein
VEPGGQGDAALGAELLAWLVERGHLEIRVGLPLIDGRIGNDGAIFHAKEGVIEDKHGQRLGFSGSVNETPNGWTSNFETIQTFCSWKPGGAEAIDDLEAGFLRLWQNQDTGARTLTLPEAIRQQLAIYAPAEGILPRRLQPFLKDLPAPEPDPIVEIVPDIDERRRIVWSYVLNAAASDLPGAERVGEGTSAVTPWPHQQRAFQRLWQQWPPRLLIADEVGLGKTVQAGLLLRQAWLSGRTRRMLGDGTRLGAQAMAAGTAREVRPRSGPSTAASRSTGSPPASAELGFPRPRHRSSWTTEPFGAALQPPDATARPPQGSAGKPSPTTWSCSMKPTTPGIPAGRTAAAAASASARTP